MCEHEGLHNSRLLYSTLDCELSAMMVPTGTDNRVSVVRLQLSAVKYQPTEKIVYRVCGVRLPPA